MFPHILMLYIGLGICLMSGIVFSQDNMDMDDSMAMKMLKKYNYMGDGHPDPKMMDDAMYGEALKMFQMVAGLNQTGTLDPATMDKLQSKRCGLPDFYTMGDVMKRKKRYVLTGSKWKDGIVGYNYINSPAKGGLSDTTVRQTIDRAFRAWADVAQLDFHKMDDTSDIEISFATSEHGDGYALDGPGGTLAHAFFPDSGQLGGDMHFDDEETWAVQGNPGTDLYYVAIHELGHSLGLQHSMDMDAIMYPYYPGYKSDLRLSQDDINGIQAVYGPKTVAPPTTRAPVRTTTNARPSTMAPSSGRAAFCTNGTVDAIGTLGGVIYVFQGSLYATLDEDGIMPGYPRPISEDWHGLPDDVDAALGWEQHRILLIFKDTQYWRYYLSEDTMSPTLETGYPRQISVDFKGGLPSTVDSAFLWAKNGRIYIITDGMYYRVRSNEKILRGSIKVKCDKWYFRYPKDFAGEWNVHDPVSAAFLYHGRTFFFSGTEFHRYNDMKYRSDNGYPKSTSESWFGCRTPGSLENPETEMDRMEREPQLAEITSVLLGHLNAGNTLSQCNYVFVVALATSLLSIFAKY